MGGVHSYSVTVQVNNRDVFAEIALYKGAVTSSQLHVSSVGISQIVSDSGVENFEEPQPMAYRRNMTSITFIVIVANCEARARWMMHYWS
jgi:hypothetical protein